MDAILGGWRKPVAAGTVIFPFIFPCLGMVIFSSFGGGGSGCAPDRRRLLEINWDCHCSRQRLLGSSDEAPQTICSLFGPAGGKVWVEFKGL